MVTGAGLLTKLVFHSGLAGEVTSDSSLLKLKSVVTREMLSLTTNLPPWTPGTWQLHFPALLFSDQVTVYSAGS